MIEIPLTKGYITIVDDEDADLDAWRWKANVTPTNAYAARNKSVGRQPNGRKKYKSIIMHREIMERVIGRTLTRLEEVDHINGNGCDNQRSNLRVCTKTQNIRNGPMRWHNSSGYKGVTRVSGKCRKPWQSSISVDRKRIYLGSYSTPEEAHEAYKQAAVKYFGEFARFE